MKGKDVACGHGRFAIFRYSDFSDILSQKYALARLSARRAGAL
jgi:hypothetical protein